MTTQLAEISPEQRHSPTIRLVSPEPISEVPADYVPPPDAVLPPAARAKRKAKSPTGKKPGRPKTQKPLELTTEAPAQQLAVATPPGGAALPKVRFSRGKVDTLLLIFGAFACFLAGGAGGYFMTGIGQ